MRAWLRSFHVHWYNRVAFGNCVSACRCGKQKFRRRP